MEAGNAQSGTTDTAHWCASKWQECLSKIQQIIKLVFQNKNEKYCIFYRRDGIM